MERYVALLGSINVGGNRLKMADLRTALEAKGFSDVETVVASGNVLFRHQCAADPALAGEIEFVLKEQFGIASFAAVRTGEEIAAAIADNPFAGVGEDKFVHTVFLEQPLDRSAFISFADAYPGRERLAPGTREFFVDYATGVAGSKMDAALRKTTAIKGRATARNVRSLQRILDRMKG